MRNAKKKTPNFIIISKTRAVRTSVDTSKLIISYFIECIMHVACPLRVCHSFRMDLPDFSVSSVTSCATTWAHCMTANVKRMSGTFLSGNNVVRISLALGSTRPNAVSLGLLSPAKQTQYFIVLFGNNYYYCRLQFTRRTA